MNDKILEDIINRHSKGEFYKKLAKEYCIDRRTLRKKLKEYEKRKENVCSKS